VNPSLDLTSRPLICPPQEKILRAPTATVNDPSPGRVLVQGITHLVVCVACRYTTGLVDYSLASQTYNPELTVDPRRSDAVIDRQIMQLKLVTNKLRKAYSGFYVDWIDIGLSVTICQMRVSLMLFIIILISNSNLYFYIVMFYVM